MLEKMFNEYEISIMPDAVKNEIIDLHTNHAGVRKLGYSPQNGYWVVTGSTNEYRVAVSEATYRWLL